MTSVEVFVRHEAELDALFYFEQIREKNPEAGLRFLPAIDETVQGLALQPLKGRPRRFRGKDLVNIRSWRVDGFPVYLIFYRFTGNRLEVSPSSSRCNEIPSSFAKALERSESAGNTYATVTSLLKYTS